ncbi:MAG: transposase [Phycisphaerales bacterium]|nr:transposase [Phycisphaerales bacterium]
MLTLLLVHLGVMLPWCFRVGGARASERSLLRDALDTLPENALLVADAGFTGFGLIRAVLARGSHVLIRVGRGAHLLKGLGYAQREGRCTVYLWPDKGERRRVPPLVLRLIRVQDVYLVTDVTDARVLPRSLAGELYRRRWGLEVAFRSLKQTLERRKVRSCTAAHAQMELSWSVVGLWVLALMGVRAVTAGGQGPRQMSVAGVLSAVRWSWWRPAKEAALRRRLRGAVQDGYARKGSKKAWRWPHKKNPPPPGPPRVTTATASEVACAKAHRAREQAA